MASNERTTATHDDADKSMLLSRRSFVKVAVGTLAALPVVAGGVRLPFGPKPTRAEAYDTTIVTARSDEAVILVTDVSAKGHTPVAGARVKVTSCFNNKVAEGTSNDRGVFKFNVADLSEDEGKKKRPAVYSFYAQIEITKEGYRTFKTGRVKIEGARGIAAPTRPSQAGVPYPSLVTFDDWDILYTANEFCVTAKNDMRHEVIVALNDLPANAGNVRVSLLANGAAVASGQAAVSGSTATVSLMDHFLLKTAKNRLPKEGTFAITYEVGGRQFQAPLSLSISESKGGYEAPGVDRNFSLSPFSEGAAGHKGRQVTFPSSIPLIGGTPIQIWLPEFDNIGYGFDPFGYVYVSLRTTEWGYKSKNGQPAGNGWQSHPRGTVAEQTGKILQDEIDNFVQTAYAIDGRNAKITKVNLLRKFSSTVIAQLSLVAKWGEKESNLIRVRFGGQVTLAIDFSMSWQFLAGPVPMVFEFAINSAFTAGLGIAASTTELFKQSAWAIDYTNSALSMTIDLAFSVSLGIGFRGLASLSLKGTYAITIFIGGGPLPKNRPKDITRPHYVIGMNYGMFVVIQLVFVTIPFKLPGAYNNPTHYDSWKGGTIKTASDNMTAMADVSSVPLLETLENGLEATEEEEQAYVLTESDFEEVKEEDEWTMGLKDLWGNLDASGNPINPEPVIVANTGELTGTSATGTVYSIEQSPDGLTGAADGTNGLGPAAASSLTSQDDRSFYIYPAKVDKRFNFFGHTSQVLNKGVKGTASKTGLVPAAVDVYCENTFGDARAKTVWICGRQFIFRLASVKMLEEETGGMRKWEKYGPSPLATYTRPRVMGEGLFDDGMYAYVFDYPGISRQAHPELRELSRRNMFDYDFDVAVEQVSDTKAFLYLFVFAVKRSEGATGTTMDDALEFMAGEQTLTLATFTYDASTRRFMKGFYSSHVSNEVIGSTRVLDAAGAGPEYRYHNYSCPRINLLVDTIDGKKNRALSLSYLHRASKTARGVLSQDDVNHQVMIGLGRIYWNLDRAVLSYTIEDEINATTFRDHGYDRSIYQAEVFDRCGTDPAGGVGWRVIMIRGRNTYYFLAEDGAAALKDRWGYYSGSLREPKLIGVYEPGGTDQVTYAESPLAAPPALVPWPGHEGWLAAWKGRLCHVTLTKLERPAEANEKYRVPEPRFVMTPISTGEFAVTTFGVSDDGQFVFYPAVREGVPGYTYDESGNGKPKPEVEEHDIMACRLRNGKFGAPFVFAQVPYDMDTLVCCGKQKDIAMSFISSNLKDRKRGLGEMRFVAMPFVRCANVVKFSVVGQYAFPGATCPFNIAIRNDGNVPLIGCSIRLHRRGAKDNSADTLTKFRFSAQTLIESNFNPKLKNGKLSGVEDDYALLPGQTSVYAVLLKVPANWSGTVQVSVTAQDFVAAPASKITTLSTMADEGEEELDPSIGYDEEGIGTIDFGSDLTSLEVELDDAAYSSIDYDAYVEPGVEYDEEEGNQYVDYIVTEDDYADEDEEYPYDILDVTTSDDVLSDDLADSDIQVQDTWGNWTDTDGISLETLPQTGDDMGPGVASAILGGLGAAMVAYSKRRMDNERAETANTDDKSDD